MQKADRRCRLLAPSSGWWMCAIPLLSGEKQTSGKQAKNDANDL